MMTDNPSMQGRPQIIATAESHLPELSRFLCKGFQMPESRRRNYTPEALGWKYFKNRGPWIGPRSFIVQADGRVLAHLGVTTTEFVSPQNPALKVTAVYPVDWLSNEQGGMLGAMLMLKAFSRGAVQYSLGSTESGRKVLIGCGFKAICTVPTFYKVFRPANYPVWSLIHGPQRFLKGAALFAVDLSRSVLPRRLRNAAVDLQLEPVQKFPEEISGLLGWSQHQFVSTSRAPELLNYFLRPPGGGVGGWLCKREGRLAGFALTSVGERDGVRIGKILDCFLAEADAAAWESAIQALTGKLADAGCDVAQTLGSTPWLQRALRANGYFPRGCGTFFLRDMQNLVPLNLPFHLTLLDGDQAS